MARRSEFNNTGKLTKAELNDLRRKKIEVDTKYEMATTPPDKIEVDLGEDGSPIILFLSDVHFGSSATDMKKIEETVKFIEDHPSARVIILGDEVDGQNPKHVTTTERQRLFDFQNQIDGFQAEVLDKIAEKTVAAVGYYRGHPGWVYVLSGADPWRMMYDKYDIEADMMEQFGVDKEKADLHRIPMVQNMSQINFNYAGHKIRSKAAHYYSGNGRADSIHSVREEWILKKGDKKVDIVAGGHYHQTSVAIENYPGSPVPAILFQCGTFKGNGDDTPMDAFGKEIGLDSVTGRSGQMAVFSKTRNIYRATNLDQGELIHSAVDLWDYDNRLAREAIELASQQASPNVTFRTRRSQTSVEDETIPSEEEQEEMILKRKKQEEKSDIEDMDYDEDSIIYSQKNLAPLYEKVSYNITSDFPILLMPFANIRMDGSYSGTEKLRQIYQDFIINNPHVLVAYLGNILDTEVSKKANRVQVLDELSGIISLIGSERTLALLLDSSMRNANWKKVIRGLDYVPPGTYVSEKTGVPLVPGGSSIEIFHGPQVRTDRKDKHSIMILDGLKKGGSYAKALMGLTTYDNRYNHAAHDVLVSGHHPHSGAGTYQKDGRNVDLINVGWLASFDDSSGKKNVQQATEGGQGLIINKDIRIPTGGLVESKELFNAILALTAARKFGLVDTK